MNTHEDFLQLFLRHQADLRAFIGSLVRDIHAREDVFQEVALILWRQFEKYDSARSFTAWMRGIAANKVMQQFEKSSRSPIAFSPEAVRAILDAHERIESEPTPRADELRPCLDRLPAKSRTLLTLRYEQTLSLDVVAQRVGSTLHAVNMALSRIRARLADCVQRRLRTAEGL